MRPLSAPALSYYYHVETKKTVWTRPKKEDEEDEKAKAEAEVADADGAAPPPSADGEEKAEKAPWIPKLKSDTDTSLFDPYEVDDTVDTSYVDSGNWDADF